MDDVERSPFVVHAEAVLRSATDALRHAEQALALAIAASHASKQRCAELRQDLRRVRAAWLEIRDRTTGDRGVA